MKQISSSRIVLVLKQTLSWLIVLVLLPVGMLGISIADSREVFGRKYPLEWPGFAAFILLGFISLFASLIATRYRRTAGFVFLITAPIMAGCLAWSERFRRFGGDFSLSRFALVFAVAAAFFVVPGFFWFFTSRAGWPPLIPARSASAKYPSFAFIFSTSLVFLTLLAVTVAMSLYIPWFYDLDCNDESPPVSVQTFPDQTVFLAKILFVARPVNSYGIAPWSIALVQRKFWGLPWWASKVVILRSVFTEEDKGKQFFVDGRRSPQLLMHFLPIVQRYRCCRTEPVDRAAVDLRVLGEGPPKSRVRIIGEVRSDYYVTSPAVPGATVVILGPVVNVSIVTDQQGIYDVSDLPPGHYSVQLQYPDGRLQGEDRFSEADLKSGDVWGHRLISK